VFHFIRVLAINLAVLAGLALILETFLAAIRPVEMLWNTQDVIPGWRWRDSPDRAQAQLVKTGIRGPQFWMADGTNQLGFRGRKIEYNSEDFVVVLVGDSHVEAAAARFEQLPEIVLEHSLRKRAGKPVRVFSIGASGWAQDQQLLALRNYFDQFRADLVVVWHTPSNDYWENAFPDRSRLSVENGAGPLKPVFFLQRTGDDETIQLFDPKHVQQPLFAQVLHRFHIGRVVLRILAAHQVVDVRRLKPNEIVLNEWLQIIPPPGGHRPVGREQCPKEIVAQQMFSPYHSHYVGRQITLETEEAVEESRGHFTPFLDPPSDRDQYTKKITRALFHELKKLTNSHRANFAVFAPDFLFQGEHFNSGVRCVKAGDRFYKVDAYLLSHINGWSELNFHKLEIEIGSYGLESIVVDLHDPIHLNFFGNTLVMEALADRLLRNGLPLDNR
jgi:hypothetical protein